METANTAASIPLSLASAADPPAALLVATGGDTIGHYPLAKWSNYIDLLHSSNFLRLDKPSSQRSC